MSGFRGEGTIILGAPRSGTTLLRRLIDAHPNIACPGETNVFSACGRFLRSERIAEGVGIGVLDGLGYAGFSTGEVLTRLRELAFSFHRDYAKRQRKPRWASKTAFDAFYIDEIEQLCGDSAFFVCIQRHGLDVACSIEELCNKNGAYLKELHDYVVRYPRILEAFAHVWVDLAQSIDAFVKRHPDNAVLVKYEDLLAQPDETMARIMARIGEEWDPALVGRALEKREGIGLGDWKTYGRESLDPSSVGRWKKLSRDTISRLAGICNATLKLCGYDPIEVEADRNPKEARRRYEVGLLLQGLKPKPDAARG
jgi:protein-tyrosine sulfotransferase